MNLSFLPGDLHLTQNAGGFFVVTVAGRKILSTKSRRSALGKYNTLKAGFENDRPAQEPTAKDGAENLLREVNDSILENDSVISRKGTPTQISSSAMFEVEAAFRAYCTDVEATPLSDGSKSRYIDMAYYFIRWLKGDFGRGKPSLGRT
jgi:hypothetical protein